ncbi:LTA synthase family protein [Aeromonas allosaccharophila]|uniref:LTA synthase family protein n=1 Tax=Aeromonas allosaccharophila TaxID=656 RepID=UPI0013CCF113|nr:LTA synthase family protein [Aeromonas allosaccharophila]WDO02755.1 LTA synthase family protein [Aeromonas allosaccharophila]
MFARFLLSGLALLALLALLLKSLLLFWSPASFAVLTTTQQLEALLWGFRFDLAAAALLWAPAALLCWLAVRLGLRRLSWLWWWVPALVLAGLQVADLMYFANAGRHIGYELGEVTREAGSLFTTALKQYPLLMITTLAGALASALLCRRQLRLPARMTIAKTELPLLLTLAVAVLCVRGSLTDLPMKPDRAYAIGNSQQALLALNPVYAMLVSTASADQTGGGTPLYHQLPQPTEPQLALLTHLDGRTPYQPPQRKMNIILMLLESWPAELMQSYNPAAPIVTPHLDALHREGLRTDGLIAGGRRTVEGFFSTLCSYQNPLEAGIPNTPLQDQHYECLPRLLSDAGWSTAIFQGMHNGETGQLAQLLGTQASYGKLEMPPPQVEQNNWGYQDPDLYRFILSKAREESLPFFYMVNNTTTHDDQLPPGEPWLFGDQSNNERQMSVLHYADKALGRFIEEYKQADLGPTLFVITADHTAGERSGHMGRYWIPFLMFATDGSIAPYYQPGIGAQQDIAPTILDVLGGKALWFTGHSLRSEPPRGGIYTASGSIGRVYGEQIVEYPMQDPDKVTCFNWRKDLLLRSPQPCDEQAYRERDLSWATIWYQQTLLFAGKSREYGLLSPQSQLSPQLAGQSAPAADTTAVAEHHSKADNAKS